MKYRQFTFIAALLGTISVYAMDNKDEVDLSGWGPLVHSFDKNNIRTSLLDALLNGKNSSFDTASVYVAETNNKGETELCYIGDWEDFIMFPKQLEVFKQTVDTCLHSEIESKNFVYFNEKGRQVLVVGTTKAVGVRELLQIRDFLPEYTPSDKEQIFIEKDEIEEDCFFLQENEIARIENTLNFLKRDEEDEIAPIKNKDASQTLGRNWKVRNPQ